MISIIVLVSSEIVCMSRSGENTETPSVREFDSDPLHASVSALVDRLDNKMCCDAELALQQDLNQHEALLDATAVPEVEHVQSGVYKAAQFTFTASNDQ